jgi:hypothetical protein
MRFPKSANKFSKVLAIWMQREGLTGPKAAVRLKVGHRSIYTWLSGQCIPPARQARLIADGMRCPAVVGICARGRASRRRARSVAMAGAA